MADRVSHDHPSVTTLRATLGRRGGTRDRELRLPGDTDPPDRDVIRLVIAGTEYHAPFERAMDDTPVLRGAFESPRLARERAGTNYLTVWADEQSLGDGRTVLVDVVVRGFRYGLRRPGTAAVYDASRPPAAPLRRIADGLDPD